MARKRRSSTVPADVVRHSPVFFDDSIDSTDSQEVVTPPWSVPQLPDSRLIPQLPRLPGVYLGSSRAGVWGGTPHAKRVGRSSLPVDRRVIVRVGKPFIPAKQGLSAVEKRRRDERGRSLFNALAIPFSRRDSVCVKRKQRREVIFAKRYSGRNGGKVYRRTYASQYSCA